MTQLTLRRALLASAAATLWAAQAGAQTAPAAPAKPAAAGVETIVVTATRRAESIQRVPGQVTALSAATLAQLNATSFADFAALVPGLSYAYETPANNLIVIRGITTGSQLSSAIGLYLDDVPLGASTSFGLGYENFSVNLYDLSRVEVLNGPQGTLYGASSLGGAVKYVSAPPDPQKFTAMEDSELSSTDHGGTNSAFRGAVNVPLPDGLGAIRLDGIDEYASGFIKDPIYHRTDQGSARTLGGRVSVLLKPADTVDVRLTAYNQSIPAEGADAAFRNFGNHAPTYGTYDQAFPTAQPSTSAVTLYDGTINWTTPYAKLTSITAYQTDDGRSNTDESLVYDAALALFGGGADAWQLHVDDHTRKFTQELRLASPDTGWFTWLVGGFLDHQQTSEIVNLLDASVVSQFENPKIEMQSHPGALAL
jgi:outer membrane receptor protein involved in Fe transport